MKSTKVRNIWIENMYWVNTMVRKLSFIEPTPKSGPCSAHFALTIIIVVHVYSKTSISINKYTQKAGEPENDAGFLKHNSQLNCSYPSKPRLVVTVF